MKAYFRAVLDPPTGAVYAKVLPIVYNGLEGYFDNLQFEKSSQVREYNALENSSFERDLAQWSRSDSFSSVTTEDKYSGGKSLKIQRSSTSGTSYAESQTIIPVKKGQVYTVSGLLKTVDFNSVGTDDGARIRIYHSSNSGGLKEFDPTKLVKTNSDWTKYVQTLTPDQDGFLKIRLEMKNASGKAFFDNLRLSTILLALSPIVGISIMLLAKKLFNLGYILLIICGSISVFLYIVILVVFGSVYPEIISFPY